MKSWMRYGCCRGSSPVLSSKSAPSAVHRADKWVSLLTISLIYFHYLHFTFTIGFIFIFIVIVVTNTTIG